jgi:hypothetical protein
MDLPFWIALVVLIGYAMWRFAAGTKGGGEAGLKGGSEG